MRVTQLEERTQGVDLLDAQDHFITVNGQMNIYKYFDMLRMSNILTSLGDFEGTYIPQNL